MNLTLWKPFSELSRSGQGSWIDRFFDDSFFSSVSPLVPALDLKEDKDQYTVSVELPGVDQKDVSITLENDVLTITGEKKVEKEEKSKLRTISERHYGSFSRSLRFPSSVDSKKVSASYDKGILEVVLPKAEEAKPKTVKIKAA